MIEYHCREKIVAKICEWIKEVDTMENSKSISNDNVSKSLPDNSLERYVCYRRSSNCSVYINKELTITNDFVCLPNSQIIDNIKVTNRSLSTASF